MSRLTGRLLLPLILLPTLIRASCQCGYTVNDTTSSTGYALFTEILETDFFHVRDVTFNDSYSIGWIPQNYNTSASAAQGPYGMAREDRNLVPNWIDDPWTFGGPGVEGVKGGDPGLELWVRGEVIGVPGEGVCGCPLCACAA